MYWWDEDKTEVTEFSVIVKVCRVLCETTMLTAFEVKAATTSGVQIGRNWGLKKQNDLPGHRASGRSQQGLAPKKPDSRASNDTTSSVTS